MEILDTAPPLAPKVEGLELDKEDSEFEIVRELGSGAYGKVFSIKSGTEYRALKVQEFFDKTDGSMIAGSVREHVFFQQFPEHPNILKCKSVWKVKQNLFFTLPLYSCDLSTLSRLSPFTFNDFLYICKSLCNGLKAMHENHWMHRDFKMENVLIDADLGVCISDFNLVRFCGIDIPLATLVPEEDLKKPPMTPRMSKCNIQQLSVNATTEVCSLWTRPPEVVLDLLAGKKRVSYGLEFDMFSLGATLMGMLAAGEYVSGSKIKGRGESSEEKYITACLDLLGVDEDTIKLYGPYSNQAPLYEHCFERVKRHILQPCWSSEQKEVASLLLVGLMHPNPKTRFTWKEVEEWFTLHDTMPSKFSHSILQILTIQGTKTRTTKSTALNFDIIEEPSQRRALRTNLNLELFWNLCGNCSIPPFIAIEVLRLKFKKGYSLQETQCLLFILDSVHGYRNSYVSSQLCYISPEDIWEVLQILPSFDPSTIHLAAALKSSPFKLCCLAAEIALTGHCETPAKLEDTKLMHLSTAAPFFAAYGNTWKSQKDLRSTWLRLLSIGF